MYLISTDGNNSENTPVVKCREVQAVVKQIKGIELRILDVQEEFSPLIPSVVEAFNSVAMVVTPVEHPFCQGDEKVSGIF